jgi:hypothetical protein
MQGKRNREEGKSYVDRKKVNNKRSYEIKKTE